MLFFVSCSWVCMFCRWCFIWWKSNQNWWPAVNSYFWFYSQRCCVYTCLFGVANFPKSLSSCQKSGYVLSLFVVCLYCRYDVLRSDLLTTPWCCLRRWVVALWTSPSRQSQSGPLCAVALEGNKVGLANHGDAVGSCSSFQEGTGVCNADRAVAALQKTYAGQTTCTVDVEVMPCSEIPPATQELARSWSCRLHVEHRRYFIWIHARLCVSSSQYTF